MKVCISICCPDRFVGGTVWDKFCPRCGKPLYDSASERAKKLIESGWYGNTKNPKKVDKE